MEDEQRSSLQCALLFLSVILALRFKNGTLIYFCKDPEGRAYFVLLFTSLKANCYQSGFKKRQYLLFLFL